MKRYTLTNRFKVTNVCELERLIEGAGGKVKYHSHVPDILTIDMQYNIDNSPSISFKGKNINLNDTILDYVDGEVVKVSLFESIQDLLHIGENVDILTVSGIEIGYMVATTSITKDNIYTNVIRGIDAYNTIRSLENSIGKKLI